MLPTYQNILIATDFTPNSDFAFKHAVMLARLHDAKIHLLHVMPQIDNNIRSYLSATMGQDRMEVFEQDHEKEARDELEKELKSFVEKELAAYPGDQVRFAGSELVSGNPAICILAAAKRLNADVIVMGTHSKGILEHAFLGSVAERVLKKSTRPVFVIPLPKS